MLTERKHINFTTLSSSILQHRLILSYFIELWEKQILNFNLLILFFDMPVESLRATNSAETENKKSQPLASESESDCVS